MRSSTHGGHHFRAQSLAELDDDVRGLAGCRLPPEALTCPRVPPPAPWYDPGMTRFGLIYVALSLLYPTWAFAQPTLRYDAPTEWTESPSRSPMRVTQFVLPRVPGDPEDAELVVFYFGGSGGSVDANLQRWIGQMEQPDGRPSFEAAATIGFDAGGLAVTLLEVPGIYVAAVRPGSTERFNKPDYRLMAAVVESPAGPYFFKLVGPDRTVERWDEAFTSFLRNVRVE